ncbi:MAG: M4 family metallopeptidase [Kiritimatiellaeota bacterium]|nr:M4 family metallopeptidase [Kiritimatiellota bacterium]
MNHYSIAIWIATGSLALALPGWAFRADDAPRPRNAPVAASAAVAAAAKPEVVRAPTFDQVAALNALPDIAVQWDAKTGVPASLRGAGLAERQMGGKTAAFSSRPDYAQDAVAVLERFSAAYRINDAAHEFAVYRVDTDTKGFHHVRLRQTAGGLRIIGGELIVHFDRSGQPYQVNGRYIPNAFVDPAPTIDAATAVGAAQRDLVAMDKPAGTVWGTPEIVIYAQGDTPALAYEMTLAYADTQAGAGCWRYWIDARTGAVLNRYNDIREAADSMPRSDKAISGNILDGEGGAIASVTAWFSGGSYWLLNAAWVINNSDNTGRYPDSGSLAFRNSNSWGASDPTEISAANNFNLIQNYYRAVHGRVGYDAKGTKASVNVHMWGGTDNAYWSPGYQAFFFYPGNLFAELAVLDVCAHEFTHAVTENTANLVYQGEPGALNESFSDIFGTVVEFASQDDGRASYPDRVAGKADWLIGEDCTYPDAVALRDMRNPQRYSDPSKYHGTYWYYGSGDNGGVHYNSGVQNHMTYLLTEGGSGNNDGISYTVTSIGIESTRQVAYRALTVYCTPSTDYRAARIAWLSAAQDLNPAWTASVQAAWSAVGVDGSTPPKPTSNLRALGLNNDYDGDQCGDFTLYDTRNGNWYVWSSQNQNWLADGANFGSSVYLPVPGDYNGGGKSDALIYGPHGGLLSVSYRENGMVEGTTGFGGDAFIPVPGDYDGDGCTDFALYDPSTAAWYILSARDRTRLAWGDNFGAPGFFPVPGDYDGDGRSDLVLYSETTGDWLILYAKNGRVERGNFGGPHLVPVPGDYDGDGVSDFALYDYWAYVWYIYSPVAGWLKDRYPWGGAAYIPVSGDFDGDGVSDLMVYDRNRAEWYIRYHSGVTRHLTDFGGVYMVPVVYWSLYGYM